VSLLGSVMSQIDPVWSQVMNLTALRSEKPGFTLNSGVDVLDRLIGSNLRPKRMIEWGAPLGSYGRLIPLLFLTGKVPPIVWVYSHEDLKIYPPAWAAWGIDLKNIFFVYAKDPVRELRPLLADSLFKTVVIDSPKKFHMRDMSFLHQKMRENGQMVFLIRHYFLSQKQGNVFAHGRFNVQYETNRGGFHVSQVKGQKQERVFVPLSEVEHAGR
jgi:hypothetical protein